MEIICQLVSLKWVLWKIVRLQEKHIMDPCCMHIGHRPKPNALIVQEFNLILSEYF